MFIGPKEIFHIAVVDKDSYFRETICRLLNYDGRFILHPVSCFDDLLCKIDKGPIDCVVINSNIDLDTGLLVKDRIAREIITPPPVIIVTDDQRVGTAIKAFRMGVRDYFPKLNLEPKILASSIIRVVKEERERSIIRAEHQQLAASSGVDQISRLEGRSRLEDRLRQLSSLNPAARINYATIIIEIEQYTNCVEIFGLKAGDEVIREFSKKLREILRSSDVCGRYAESTFLVITDCSRDPAVLRQICERFVEQLSSTVILNAGTFQISARVVGSLCPTGSPNPSNGSAMIAEAERLLAKAQTAGLRCWTIPEPEITKNNSMTPCLSQTPNFITKAAPAADQLLVTNRRREMRTRVFKRGFIHAGGTFNCIIRNISAGGVGLRLEIAFAVPEQFDLEIFGSGQRRRVSVRWQSKIDLGVQYIPN